MRLVPVVCCLLLVLAGCQSTPSTPDATVEAPTDTTVEPTTQQPTATTKTAEPSATTSHVREIDVEGGPLPYDPNTVWQRVETMVGADVAPPLTVRVHNLSSGISQPSHFQRLLGVEDRAVTPAGLTESPNLVHLDESVLDRPNAREGTLAHEFVHVVQFRTGELRTLAQTFGDSISGDEAVVFASIREGSATYVDRHYQRQYLDGASYELEEAYRNSTTAVKSLYARYVFGARYVNDTVGSPAELQTIYENPPRTTEELIHGLEPGSEPPATLSVNAAQDAAIRGPLGELQIRTIFGTALNETAAARAADGWGNDRRVAIGTGNETEYAWVLRWDDAANATEFERGVDSYLDARSNLNASVRVDRVAPETTVLFVGSESFVAETTATGTNSSVSVRS